MDSIAKDILSEIFDLLFGIEEKDYTDPQAYFSFQSKSEWLACRSVDRRWNKLADERVVIPFSCGFIERSIVDNNMDALRFFINKRGFHPFKGNGKRSLLKCATVENRPEAVRLLLDSNAERFDRMGLLKDVRGKESIRLLVGDSRFSVEKYEIYNEIWCCFENQCKHGDVEAIQVIRELFPHRTHLTSCLKVIVENNRLNLAQLMLEESKGGPLYYQRYSFCKVQSVEMAQMLLNRTDWMEEMCTSVPPDLEKLNELLPKLNPVVQDNKIIYQAISKNHHHFSSLLLKDPRVLSSVDIDKLFSAFILNLEKYGGKLELLYFLSTIFQSNVCNNLLLRTVCTYGFTETSRLFTLELLKKREVDPTANCHESLIKCYHPDVLKEIIKDPRIDLTSYGLDALIHFTKNNWVENVKILMMDKRINLSMIESTMMQAIQSRAFIIFQLCYERCKNHSPLKGEDLLVEAAGGGSPEIVQLLLDDPDVDPTIRGAEAMDISMKREYPQVFAVLFKDSRLKYNKEEDNSIDNFSLELFGD